MLLINNWRRALAGSLSPSATTLTLDAAPGISLQPDETVTLTLSEMLNDVETVEIIHATAVSGSTLTIERGKEGTAPRAWADGTLIEQRITAGQLQQLKADAISQIPADAPAAEEPVLGYLRSAGQWVPLEEPGGSGGLAHWTESDDGTAAVLTPTADRDAVIAPAAGKALRMDAAGDARGAGAVDLQTERDTADQVAAGLRSAIMAGSHNKIGSLSTDTLITASYECVAAGETEYVLIAASFEVTTGADPDDWAGFNAILASGRSTMNDAYLCAMLAEQYSTMNDAFLCAMIAGQYSDMNDASESAILGSYNVLDNGGSYCFIAGTNNTATGTGSYGSYATAIVGCEGVTVTDGYCTSAIGSSYTEITGDHTVAIGASAGEASAESSIITGSRPTDRGIHGAFVFGGDRKVTNLPLGAIQAARYTLGRQTTNATPDNLAVRSGGQQITLTDDGAYAMTGTVVAREGTDAKAWRVQLLAVVDTGTMTLIGTPTVDVIAETAGATSWALALGTTGDTLNLTATGEAARTIRWSAYLDSAESA